MLENCRWVLWVSRLYGCHPHTIRERSVSVAPRRFRPLMLYSLFTCSLYCLAAYHASGTIECHSTGAMIVGCVLQQIDRYTRGLYMIVTPVLSCLGHLEFEHAVAAGRRFDDMTRHRRRDDDDDDDKPAANRRTQWLTLLGIHAVWAAFGGFVKYATDHQLPWQTIMVQSTTRAAFSTQAAKFCFLFDALRRRFRLVNQLCSDGGKSPEAAVSTVAERVNAAPGRHYLHRYVRRVTVVGANTRAFGSHAQGSTILHLQRLHRCLTDATKHLNSYYNPLLLCWLVCSLLDVVMYIFFTLYTTNDAKLVMVQCVILTIFSIQIIAVSHACHLTCDQANALARLVLSMKTHPFGYSEFLTEAIELGVYLHAHPLRIRVYGLFNVDKRFPFLVFGVMLMYVILASSIH